MAQHVACNPATLVAADHTLYAHTIQPNSFKPQPIMKMKTTKNLLLAGMLAAFGCSIANAQVNYSSALTYSGATLIYSNAFNGPAVTVDGTPPTVANSILGGSSSAIWNVVSNNAAAGAYLNQDGTIGLLGNSYLLPFTPKTNYIYVLTVSANLPVMSSGKWINWGFAQFNNKSTAARFADSAVNGYDFTIGTCVAGSEQYWAGPHATGYGISAQLMPTAGNHVLQIILDTTLTNFLHTTNWVGASFVDGKQLGTNWVFTAGVPIGSAGLGQTAQSSTAGIQYIYFTLSATPIVIGQQPVSAGVSVGAAFTNKVVVAATKPSYQWFTNNVPIANATNASLVLNPVTVANAGTNYYVVITNSYGSITSAVASLTVYTNPNFAAAYPVAYTNPITLFGGTNDGTTIYAGSSPRFSVSTLGGQPITYQWLTNGVAVGGATGASFTFTNCQLDSPANFSIIASNSYGMNTNAWSVSYVPAPTPAYPQTVLAYQPLGYWQLSEGPDNGTGDQGVLALDYASGNNGLYTNAVLGVGGYSGLDPTVTSVLFSSFASPDSDVFNIQGIDFTAPTNTSPTFSVAAWVNGSASQTSGAGIVSKGYGGAEQFLLDVNGNKYRFAVRDAAGNLYSATAAAGPNATWDFLVGVCDQVHSNLTLYTNGVPAAKAAIAPGSGLLASSLPVTIGARSSSATVGHNDLQFKGYVNEVSVFNSALSVVQQATLYTAAGYSIPLTFVPPPANFVFQPNKTLTIPASAFGATNLGYYWTNVTLGGVLASGAINALVDLDATLTIPNAAASLSGDQLELVITNATSFNNWFVTLFTPPPPNPLPYSDPTLYSNYFNGGAWSISGLPLTAANLLVGGTNTTWTDALGTNNPGSMQASGVDATTVGDSWIVPFTPRAGYVYTATASLTFSGNPGNWVGMGFAQNVTTNATGGRYNDGATSPNGYDFVILTEASGNVQYFSGPGATPVAGITNANGFFTAGVGTHTVEIVLDTTGTQWVMYGYVDSKALGTNIYAANPPIGAVGFTQNGPMGTPGFVQWNSFSLTQAAPVGVPPYLFAPLPPTSVTLLMDTPLSIPVSAFGSVPVGYYWSNTNTAAVLGSGATNDVAPLAANLSVASVPISWNGNTLALVVTNAYGTNISLVSLTVVDLNPTNFTFSVSNGLLTLSWPADHLGWTLQAQTNAPSLGLSTNWLDVAGSSLTNEVVIPIGTTNGSVFFRLRHARLP
jgi:hypothetical protein